MSEEALSDIQKYGYNPEDMPDCFLPDNFDEVFQRIGIHGTRQRSNRKTGKPEPPHHIEGGVTEEEYVQLAVSVMTAPDAIVSFNQRGGVTHIYGSEIDGQNWILVVPENIDGGKQDPTMFPIKKTFKKYFSDKMSSNWREEPRVLYDSGVGLELPKRVLDARREAKAEKLNLTLPNNNAKNTNQIKAQRPVKSATPSAAQPIVATDVNNQRQSESVTHQNSSERVSSTDPQTSVTADPKVNSTSLDAASVDDTTSSNISVANSLTSTKESISIEDSQQISNESAAQPDMVSIPSDGEATGANLQSGAHIDTSVDHSSAVASAQPVAEPATSHDVETASLDTADMNAVDATDESLSASGLTSEEAASVSDATFDSSDAGSIEAFEMDTPGTDELSDASEGSLKTGDQPVAVDASPAEQAESLGDAVDAEGVSDLETGAPSAEDDESPSALDVVAYEAVESGEISLDGVLAEDDVGTEDVAREEDNGELGPDFLSGDESAAVDQVAVAESVDGAQDALSNAEMDDGDDAGVESEAGVDGELGAESDAGDFLSSDLSLENSEETADIDDGSLDVDEQATVEDVAALEDAASVEDESDIDLDAALSAESAMEDQLGAVDGNDDDLDFVSEAEVAELEASLSDSNAALDDDFMSEDEHADMATQDSPSALDDTTDLQDDVLSPDDTSSVDDDFLSMDDLAVDEEDFSDSAVDASDEIGFDEPSDVGLDADNDGLDIDTNATDIDANDDIDADDDDDVSESGGFSL